MFLFLKFLINWDLKHPYIFSHCTSISLANCIVFSNYTHMAGLFENRLFYGKSPYTKVLNQPYYFIIFTYKEFITVLNKQKG